MRVVLLVQVWGLETLIFQLSGFYSRRVMVEILHEPVYITIIPRALGFLSLRSCRMCIIIDTISLG